MKVILGVALALAGLILPASARDICTLVADAQTRAVLLAEGDCNTRVTPASTFKLPLAVMAFDAGILTGPDAPVISFEAGDPDWGVDWKKDTDPAAWMKNSVLWYSQRLAAEIGADALSAYARDFGYGNADFSGDAGYDNGLERAWVASSLLVSPLEQAGFLAALVQGQLPVHRDAMAGAIGLVESAGTVGGWQISGKTGSAFPRNVDGSFDYARGLGWYVGWAERGGHMVVFVRLTQDSQRHDRTAGLRARDAVLAEWIDLANRAGLDD